MAVLVLVGALAVSGFPDPPVSAAAPASSRAAALAAEITSQSNQVHRVFVAYQAALAKVDTLKTKVAAVKAAVVASGRSVAALRVTLRQEAVKAFVELGEAPGQLLDTMGSNPSSYEVGQVYLEVTAGQVNDGLARYKQAEASYRSEDAALVVELDQARTAAASLASQDQSLRATLDSESATLAQVQQLASQVVAAEAPPGRPAPQGLPTPKGLKALAVSPPPVINVTPSLDFSALAQCESGGDYSSNTGNGYYGGFQFSASTWANLGFTGLPSNASPGTQIEAAQRLQARSGWGQWPACAAALGLL